MTAREMVDIEQKAFEEWRKRCNLEPQYYYCWVELMAATANVELAEELRDQRS